MAKEIAFNIKITGSKDVLDIQNRIKALKKELAESKDPAFIAKASEDLAKLGVQLKEAQRQARLTQAELTAKDTTIGSYTRLSAQLVLARERFKELAAGGKASAKEIEAARKEAAGLDAQLKKIDANTGVFGRNVGNYAGSLRGMFGQLKGAINQTALFGNIRNIPGLFGLVFSAVEKATKAYDEYMNATNAAYAVTKKLNTAVDESVAGFVKEKIALDTVFDAAQKTEQGTAEHKNAIDAINETYGKYLPNLLTEKSTQEEIAAAQKIATAELVKNTIQKIKAATVEKIFNELLQKQLEKRRAETTISQGGFVNFINDLTGTNAQAIKILEQNIAKTAKEIGLVEGAVKDLEKTVAGVENLNFSTGDIGSTDAEKKVIQAAKEAQNKIGESALAAQKKEQERLKKQQEDFANDTAKFTLEKAKNIADLNEAISKAVVDGIVNDGDRARAQEMLNFKLLEAQRKAEFEELKALFIAQQDKIRVVFGENSKELIAFTIEKEQELAAIQAQYDQLSEAETVLHQQKLTEIDKQGQEQRAQEEQEAFKARIEQAETANRELSNSYELQLSELKTRLAKGLVDLEGYAREAYEIERKAKEDQLKLIQDRIENGIFAGEEERQQLVLQAQQLNQDLAELEAERTEKVVEETEKQKDARRTAFEEAAQLGSELLQFGQELSDGIAEQEQARLQKQIDFRNSNIENLKEQLSTASGLEAQFLQNKITAEENTIKQVEKQQAASRKRAAIAGKAFAIAQATINAALSITALNAAIVDPTPVQAFRIAALALTTGLNIAQIGIIAATPLKYAKGGFTGSGSGSPDETGFKPAGIVHEGEYVVPKRMVDSPTFSPIIQSLEASRRGFAAGGFTAPTAPNFAAKPNLIDQSNDMMQLILETNALARKTSNDLRQLQFVATPDTKNAMDNDTREVNFIKSNQKL